MRRESSFERHILADESDEHPLHVGDDLVDMHGLGLARLLATESEQLCSERRCTPGRLQNLSQFISKRIFGRESVIDELRVATDDGQQVVEVVRDSAGQLSDSLHLLGLAKLVLLTLLGGGVLHDHREGTLTSSRADDLTIEPDRDQRAISTDLFDLRIVDNPELKGLLDEHPELAR